MGGLHKESGHKDVRLGQRHVHQGIKALSEVIIQHSNDGSNRSRLDDSAMFRSAKLDVHELNPYPLPNDNERRIGVVP